MLAATAVASPPLALIPLTTSSQAGSLRLDTTTLAPCAAICSQIERPMPRLPPVTTATLPERSNIVAPVISSSPAADQRIQPIASCGHARKRPLAALRQHYPNTAGVSALGRHAVSISLAFHCIPSLA